MLDPDSILMACAEAAITWLYSLICLSGRISVSNDVQAARNLKHGGQECSE